MTTPTIPFYPITHDDGVDITTALNGILNALNIQTQLVAGNFDSSVTYAIGDYVIYNNTLYRFTSAHSAGAWNSSHVTAVIIGSELKSKQNTLQWDTTPTTNSTKPVTSGGIKTYVDNKVLYYSSGDSNAMTVNSGTNTQIGRIPAGTATDSKITTNTVVLSIVFANPSAITSDVSWTSYNGYIVFNGTCTSQTSANVILGQKGN